MPQKKNPDVLELIRARTARVIGDLMSLLVLVKGLPLAYNRDLQEDKEPLFDAFDTTGACLEMATLIVANAQLRADRIAEKLDQGFLDATTLMEYLIQQGIPQRTAHEVVGNLVRLCEERSCRLSELSQDDFTQVCPGIKPDVKTALGVANTVKAFRSYGSSGPGEVEAQLKLWTQKLGM
jgi:argininosuccinate lyase